MSQPISIGNGARISADEVARIEAAVDALAKDHHAPKEITVKATLHVHHEYPKTLYKGKVSRAVGSSAEESAAIADGFGPYDHAAFNPPAEE